MYIFYEEKPYTVGRIFMTKKNMCIASMMLLVCYLAQLAITRGVHFLKWHMSCYVQINYHNVIFILYFHKY